MVLASRTGPAAAAALAALSQASRDLGAGSRLEPVLAQLAEAAALGAGAELAVAWMPQRDGRDDLSARAVWSDSAALPAEMEGRSAASLDAAAEHLGRRLGESAERLVLPFEAADGRAAVTLARRGAPFDRAEESVASLAADLAGLAVRLCADGRSDGAEASTAIEIAGEALTAVAGGAGAAGRIARLAVLASDAEAAIVWRVRDERLEAEGAHGGIEASPELELAARAALDKPTALPLGLDAAQPVVTLQLGQPALGVLQLRFSASRVPDARGLG